MKNNSLGKLLAPGFLRLCAANFLLQLSVYILCPMLPFMVAGHLDVPVSGLDMGFVCFVLCSTAVGVFNAYLGDTYKRKYVFMAAQAMLLAVWCGMAFVADVRMYMCLMALAGAAYGVAVPAGITLSIDITASSRRSDANGVYALVTCLGIMTGTGLGTGLSRLWGLQTCIYVSAAAVLVSIVLAGSVYVAFRAPIGLRLVSMDRFFLPNGWPLFLNVLLMFYAAGLLMPLTLNAGIWSLVLLALLSAAIVPLTRMFVDLSHHCQRASANTTCALALNIGIMAGMTTAFSLMDVTILQRLSLVVLAVTLLLFFTFTLPYVRRKKMRE